MVTAMTTISNGDGDNSAHAHTQIHEIVDDGVEDIAGRLIGRLAEHAEQVSVFIR